MKRLFFLTVSTMILFGLIWLVGCSDDSDDGVGSNLPAGDTNATEYQVVNDVVFDDQFMGGIDMTLMMSTMLVDSIPGASMTRSLSPSLSQEEDVDITITSGSYTYNGGWHIFTLAGTVIVYDYDGNDTVDFDGVDSIQVLASGSVQTVPNDLTDELRYRVHMDMDTRAGDFSRNAVHRVQMERIAGTGDMVELNGTMVETVEAQVTDTSGTCTVDYGSNITASGIEMDMSSDDCPQAGSLNATVVVDVACIGTGGLQLTINGTWTVTSTFNGITETDVLSDGTHQWTTVDTCGGGTAKLAIW